ncbi:MAG TPA: hypothetical protein VKT33_09510 [Candidatus Angelobacter sp.]|nr:hypothetical protein [Candidatus Angelobacter sp.]
MRKAIPALFIVFALLILQSCGGGGSTPPPPTIVVTPSSATVGLNSTQSFSASSQGAAATAAKPAVNWNVNGTAGGNSTVGTIDQNGLYTAPASFPSPNAVTITAVLQSNGSVTATAAVTVAFPNDNSKAQSSPVKMGTTGGNSTDHVTSGNTITCCSGTLGSLMTRGGTTFILSNNHVLDKSDTGANGDPVTQPGLVDNNCNGGMLVANLTQAAALKPTSNTTTGACAGSTILCGPAPNNVDAAIAAIVTLPTTNVDLSGAILDLGASGATSIAAAPPSATLATGTAVLAANEGVAKSGRSTGLTCSTLQSVNTTVLIDYDASCGGAKAFTAVFSNQLIINGGSFSAGGDSGSLIVTSDTARPVGLLYGGNTTSTSANPIQDVITAFTNGSGTPAIVGGGDHPVSCRPEIAAGAANPSAGASSAQLTPAQLQSVNGVLQKYSAQLMQDSAVSKLEPGMSADDPQETALVIHLSSSPALAIPAQLDGIRTRVVYDNAQQAPVLAMNDLNRATAVKEAHVSSLMEINGVQGVGVGRSDDNPVETALVIYVEEGKFFGQLPRQIDGMRTKIVTGDRFRAFGWGKETRPPASSSCSKKTVAVKK